MPQPVPGAEGRRRALPSGRGGAASPTPASDRRRQTRAARQGYDHLQREGDIVKPAVLRRFPVTHDVICLVMTCLACRQSCVVEEVV